MTYTLIVGTKSYDLPKKTLAIVEKLDGVVALDKNPRMNTRDKYQSILNLEEELLGKIISKRFWVLRVWMTWTYQR
ncbi:MAG: hypothetical protein V8S42_07410 [Lachnospiraceae bacterium]